MKGSLLILSLCVAVFGRGSHALKLPSYFGKPCSRSAPEAELSACCEKAANQGIPVLANGDRKLRIPNMDPLLVPRVSLSQGSSQIGLSLTWEPLEIHGLRAGRVSNMKVSWKKKTSEFDVTLPRFTLAGKYTAKGRILLLPLTGSGPSNFTFDNLKVHYSFDWPLEKGSDGKEYATLANSKVKILGADGLKCELKGLFNGDRMLGEQMNRFLNENWQEVLRELGPSMVEAAVQVIEMIIRNLVSSVPIPDLIGP